MLPLAPGTPAAPELLRPGTLWLLQADLDLYSSPRAAGLATQAARGRCLELLPAPRQPRLRVRLVEDGYPGWIGSNQLLGCAVATGRPRTRHLDAAAIAERLGVVLAFALAAGQRSNVYLWGGTVGPDFDCSGLVQAAYASAGIWLPRDAYLQERFCQPVAVHPGVIHRLRPADLLFFGTPQRCSHVGLHLGGGRYLHSSRREHGRNGIGIDDLSPHNTDPVAAHYRRELRGAGRVMRCHGGSPLPA